MLKYFNKKFLINFFLILSIFFLDRFSKIYVINFYEKNQGSDLYSSKFLNLSLIWNEGVAFGLFSFNDKFFYHILTFLIGIVILIIIAMLNKSEGIKKYSLIMILGGALGNFYDRIFFEAVPDFIDFHVENFHWFIFNVSDIFISLGVIIMIILEIISSKKESLNEKN
tara:strand:- start:1003 stop:1506 length:504 start_codon:yes stop_codon:yes gene_type:complete